MICIDITRWINIVREHHPSLLESAMGYRSPSVPTNQRHRLKAALRVSDIFGRRARRFSVCDTGSDLWKTVRLPGILMEPILGFTSETILTIPRKADDDSRQCKLYRFFFRSPNSNPLCCKHLKYFGVVDWSASSSERRQQAGFSLLWLVGRV